MALLGVVIRFLLRSDGIRSRLLPPSTNGGATGGGSNAAGRYEPEFAVWPAIAVVARSPSSP